MNREDARRVECHWGINPNGNLWNLALIVEKMKVKNKFLCALDRESRNDELSTPLHSSVDRFFESRNGVNRCLVKTVAIGALKKKNVDPVETLRVFDDRFILSAKIA